VGELNKIELNVRGKGVGFDPSSQAPSFEDILNLIKGADISFNPAITPEGSLKVQGRSIANKEEKGNDFPINLSIFGLVAYGQIKQIFEEEDAKADNVLNGADTNLSTEEKTNTSLVQFKNLKEQSQNTNNEFFIVKPDEPQTKEFAQGFFDNSELEFYPKEEHTKAGTRNNFAPISLKIAKDVLEDLSQKAEKSELLPTEKGKREEENSHLYNMGVSHQRFEDRIENVQEVKNAKPFHAFHEAKSLYVKLEEGDFRIRVVKDAISVKVDFREDFRPPTAQEVQNLIESLSKVGFRMEMLSLNGKNLQWEFRQGQEDKRGSRSREVSPYQVKDRQEFSLYL